MTESVANLDWRCRFLGKKNSEKTIRYFCEPNWCSWCKFQTRYWSDVWDAALSTMKSLCGGGEPESELEWLTKKKVAITKPLLRKDTGRRKGCDCWCWWYRYWCGKTMLTEPTSAWRLAAWVNDKNMEHPGGLYPYPDSFSDKTVWVGWQRKAGRVGKGPGKTTGWFISAHSRKNAGELY